MSVFVSWTIIHTVFTLRYARLYYAGQAGGINFNQTAAPDYGDFAYLSFTIGMTFQVSDTNIGSGQIRRTALRHAWLSFPMDAVIIATTINPCIRTGKMTQPDQHLRTPPGKTRSSPQKSVSSLSLCKSMIRCGTRHCWRVSAHSRCRDKRTSAGSGAPDPLRIHPPFEPLTGLVRRAARPPAKAPARIPTAGPPSRCAPGGLLAGQGSLAASPEGSAAVRPGSPGTASPTPPPDSRTTCSVRAASGLPAVWSPTGTPARSAPFSTSNASPSGLSVSSDGVTATLLIVLF
jgi:hypothetical protein